MEAIRGGDAAAAEDAARRHLLSVSADLAMQDFDRLIREVSSSNISER
jgi:DNA-binding GntR family transcriptional regulator